MLRIPLKAFQSNLIKKTSVAKGMYRCILFGVALPHHLDWSTSLQILLIVDVSPFN